MILVVLFFFIAISVAGILLFKTTKHEDGGIITTVIGLFSTCVTFIIIGCLAVDCSDARAITRKIAVYEAENAKIEERISTAVSEYLTHEKDIVTDVSEDISDPVAIIMAYPELNSSNIVTKQINVWEKNNDEIKQLKSDRVAIATKQWWLYFGGDRILEEVDAELEAETVNE